MILDRITQIGQVIPWTAKSPVHYLYTYGIAGERFFREIKEKAKLFGTRCPNCHLIYLPPKIYCERCFEGLEEWVEVKGEGRIYTYTIAYYDLDNQPLEKPAILALIVFEGVCGGLVHKVEGVEIEKVRIGMPVIPVFKSPQERVGSINDIKYFKPI